MQRIGGSDASCIAGMNPYKSAYSLWAEKAGLIEPEDISGKEAVRLGNYLEDYVAKRFEEETGKKVRRENATWINDAYPFAHGNFDRLLVGENAGLEIKTTSALNLKKFKGGEYPDTYYSQCVHYLMVSGMERWYLAVLIGNQEVKIFTIERDEEEIRNLAAMERDFWQKVLGGTPPEIDGSESTGRVLNQLHPEAMGYGVDLGGMALDMQNYFRLLEQKKEIEDRMGRIVNEAKQYLGEASEGTWMDIKVTWKPQTRRSLNSKLLLQEHPELNTDPRYWNETTTRVFRATQKG